MQELLQIVVTGISLGMIFGLVALGFVLIYQVTRVLNFAQGSFVAIGGLVSASLVASGRWPLPITILVTMVAGMLLGWLVGGIAMRVRHAGEVVSLIITVGLSIVLEGVALAIFGDQPLSFTPPVGARAFFIGKVAVLPEQLLVVGVGLVLVGLCQWLISRTLLGMALRACAANASAAQIVGVSPARMAWFAFALAGVIGSLVGFLVTPMTSMGFGSDINWTVNGFSAAIVGGLGDPMRAVLGGLLLGLVESLVGGYVSSAYQTAGALVVMLAVLIWRPQGLMRGGTA